MVIDITINYLYLTKYRTLSIDNCLKFYGQNNLKSLTYIANFSIRRSSRNCLFRDSKNVCLCKKKHTILHVDPNVTRNFFRFFMSYVLQNYNEKVAST